MNPDLVILCVDDKTGVLDAVVRDLAPFENTFCIETASSADEARAVVTALPARNRRLALALSDHRMPGESGADFLLSLNVAPDTRSTRKLLFTAQSGNEDTIRALNPGGFDHYVTKPWLAAGLRDIIREQLTSYVIHTGLDPIPYLAVLETARLAESLRRRNPSGAWSPDRQPSPRLTPAS
jgi:two-component system chemotaxis response regulator CheY